MKANPKETKSRLTTDQRTAEWTVQRQSQTTLGFLCFYSTKYTENTTCTCLRRTKRMKKSRVKRREIEGREWEKNSRAFPAMQRPFIFIKCWIHSFFSYFHFRLSIAFVFFTSILLLTKNRERETLTVLFILNYAIVSCIRSLTHFIRFFRV